VINDGQSIGRIKQEREEEPRNPQRTWSWSLTTVGAQMAPIKMSCYGATIEEVKTAFREALAAYRAWFDDLPPDRRPR
jgi:hypothetical protein